MKKAEIICTAGPSASDKNIMVELVENGMDVMRFDFSHGDYEEYRGRLELLKDVHKELDTPVAALLDTKGPEIYTGQLENGKKITLKEGQTYTLTTREVTGDNTIGYISYGGLNSDAAPGNKVLIDDGLVEMDVVEVKDTGIICTVVNGGGLGEEKGMDMPNVKTKLPVPTDKNKESIRSGIRHGFGFIVTSFVRTVDCIQGIKEMLEEQGSGMKIITKIQNMEGIENLDAIIETADGTMVTRDDMNVEVPTEKVPHIQRKTIRKCNEACKIVITATQMLDFTARNPRSAGVEATDVANAVYNGTDAVILSGETAMGRYPTKAPRMVVSITQEAESHLDYTGYRQRKVVKQNMENVSDTMCFASVSTAHDLEADMIIAPSITGFAAQMLSKRRPEARTIGMSPSITIMRQMQLQWGIVPVWSCRVESTDELTESSVEELKNRGFVMVGEPAIITVDMVTYAKRHKATT